MKYQNYMRSYISERRSFGFQLKCEERYLLKFAKFADGRNITSLEPPHFFGLDGGIWKCQSTNLETKTECLPRLYSLAVGI